MLRVLGSDDVDDDSNPPTLRERNFRQLPRCDWAPEEVAVVDVGDDGNSDDTEL